MDAEQAKLPPYSLERVQVLCDETEQALADNEEKNESACRERNPFVACSLERGEYRHGILQSNAEYGATAGEKLMLLQGWAPASRVGEISEWLDAQHVYYEVTLSRTGRQRAYTVEQQRFLCLVRAYMQALYAAQV